MYTLQKLIYLHPCRHETPQPPTSSIDRKSILASPIYVTGVIYLAHSGDGFHLYRALLYSVLPGRGTLVVAWARSASWRGFVRTWALVILALCCVLIRRW